MNKSADEYGKIYLHPYIADLDEPKLKIFIAGHHSRDEEVKKLVEVLRELINWPDLGDEWFEGWDDGDDYIDGAEMQQTAELQNLLSKAKEALKPYQNS